MKTINEISTANAPQAIGPYAQAVAAGDYIYASGQIPLRLDGTLVVGDIVEQVNQVLANLDGVLTASGVGRTNVVKAVIYMTDLADFGPVNDAFAAFFGEHRPARSTVQVAALPKGANVEIELIAMKTDG